MIRAQALDAMNRARGENPLVLLLTRRRSPASDAAVQAVTDAAREVRIDALSLDVDDPANTAFLDEYQAHIVPEMLLFAKGVLLERTGVRDASDAKDVLLAALPRAHRTRGS